VVMNKNSRIEEYLDIDITGFRDEVEEFKEMLDGTGRIFGAEEIRSIIEIDNIYLKFSNRFLLSILDELKKMQQKISVMENRAIFLSPIPLNEEQRISYNKYNKLLKWLNKEKSKYENRFIAYIEEEDSFKIIADADTEDSILKKVDDLIREKKELLNKNISFHNFGETSGFFKY